MIVVCMCLYHCMSGCLFVCMSVIRSDCSPACLRLFVHIVPLVESSCMFVCVPHACLAISLPLSLLPPPSLPSFLAVVDLILCRCGHFMYLACFVIVSAASPFLLFLLAVFATMAQPAVLCIFGQQCTRKERWVQAESCRNTQ